MSNAPEPATSSLRTMTLPVTNILGLVFPNMTVGTLILLRHGESDWNAKNLFTGWVDVGLTEKGFGESVRAGELLRDHDVLPDVVHTSVLKRAIATAGNALGACDRQWIPVRRHWRLNERHYGDLQGKD